MSTYAVSMDCPNATMPSVLWHVIIQDDQGSTGNTRESLWVPSLETWTLDTLRMALHELAAFLPAHDVASATIEAGAAKPRGRAPKAPRAPQAPRLASDRAMLRVSARGWSAWLWTDRNEVCDDKGAYLGRSAGEWSEPMVVSLLDLASKSPFPLEHVAVVRCADPRILGIRYPSRRDVIRGVEEPYTDAAGTATATLKRSKRLKRLIDDILDHGDK